MAKRKSENATAPDYVDVERRAALVENMKALAFSEPQLQTVLLRLARVGGLVEVEAEIRKLRGYAARAAR